MGPAIVNFDSVYCINEGYGSAGEGILLALDKQPNIDIYTDKNWDRTNYEGLQSRTIELCERGFSPESNFGIRFSQPDSFDKIPEAVVKIGWCLWEHNNLPKDWIEGLHSLSVNFVSCTHNKQLLDSIGTQNVFVVKLGVNPEIYFYQPREHHEKFIFIISGTLNSRKSPSLVYDVFQELFANNRDVRLIIKSTEQDRVELEETHNIQIINQTWPASNLAKLLRTADCFVLPTQGEGFGLCPVESMAVGTTVICTNWSGPADYLDERYAYKLGYTLKKHEIKGRAGLYEYAAPDRGHLKELMWLAFTHQDEVEEKGKLAAIYVAENLTWKHTANEIMTILKSVILRRGK
jgi:glycosyltransferase involved in cell wall biosynthesis